MCDTEVYTIRVDSVYAASNTSFVSYLNIPLRNVIKAELLSCSFHGNAASIPTSAMYVHVEELVSKFLDRGNLNYNSRVAGKISTEGIAPYLPISNTNMLATSLVCIPLTDGVPNHQTIFTSASYFPVEVVYIDPIRQIEKLTINLYASSGGQPTFNMGPTFLTFRFTCSKPNRCLYPDRGGVPLL
jgi:hypothetical protein